MYARPEEMKMVYVRIYSYGKKVQEIRVSEDVARATALDMASYEDDVYVFLNDDGTVIKRGIIDDLKSGD